MRSKGPTPWRFSLIKTILFPLCVGFVIFIISEVFGVGFELSFWTVTKKGIGFNLPVPYHLQTTAFILALILISISFLTILRYRKQRIFVIIAILLGFFVLFPLEWLFGISHGHVDIMIDKLINLPQTLKVANTFIEEEKILEIPTGYGLYKYRFYFDRKTGEYVYEIWHQSKLVYTDRIYHFSRRCLESEPERCLFVTLPYTLIDLRKVDTNYEQAIIISVKDIFDINGDGIIDLVVHEYSGNGDRSDYKIFSLGETLTLKIQPAPEPRIN